MDAVVQADPVVVLAVDRAAVLVARVVEVDAVVVQVELEARAAAWILLKWSKP